MRNTLINIFDGIRDPRKIDKCTYETFERLFAIFKTDCVTFKEDDCRARRDNAAQNLSLIKKIALQVAKATDDRLSVSKRLVRASMDSDYLMLLLKNYGFR